MTCRSFEHQVADWLSQRLSPESARTMAAHQKMCASCARTTMAESEIRECWRGRANSLPAPDLWPRLAQSLEAQAHSPARVGLPRPRWAIATALVLATLSVCQWSRLPSEQIAPTNTAAVPQNAPLLMATDVQSHAAVWSALGTVAVEDPAVDDPVGANMENIWICLKTDRK